MKLSQAFDQIDVSLGEAQAYLTTIVTGMRDRYPDTYTDLMQQISVMEDRGPSNQAVVNPAI